jgi:hypothetical protein
MAGSYKHCIDEETGEFRFDLIENLGDAHEACEMMVFMIKFIAHGNKAEIDLAQKAYYAGLLAYSGKW